MKRICAAPLFLAGGGADPPPDYLIWVLFGAAGILGLIAILCSWRVRRLLANAVYSEAIVVQLDKQFGGGLQVYAPVFTFTASDQLSYTVHSSVFSYPPACQIGDKLRVLYREGCPQNAEYVGLFAQWGVVLISGCLSIASFILGAALILFSRHVI
ncbi:MAG: DUF3592 domain-containing protein [Luteolibacter sp.]